MRRIIVFVVGVLWLASGGTRAGAQASCTNANLAGRLDCGFAQAGWTPTQVTFSRDSPFAMAIQADGKTVVAGIAYDYAITDVTGRDFGVTRYNADGSLDATFGGDGIVTTNSTDFYHDRARALAIQADGKIVVGGTGGADDFFIVRYNTDGSLDTTFGFNNGKVLTDLGGTGDDLSAIVVQPDGKIIAVGTGGHAAGAYEIGAIVRYNADGTLDTSFDGDGKLFLTDGTDTRFTAVRVQADGKIVASHHESLLGWESVRRFNANGSPDTSFGTNGRVLVAEHVAEDLLIEPDGKIIVGGSGETSTRCLGLSRLSVNGALESTKMSCLTDAFGTIDSIARQSDGKIVAVGYYITNSTVGKAAVYRFDSALELEQSFNNGLGRFEITFRGTSVGTAVAVQPDNKIVFAGVGVVPNVDSDTFFNVGRLHGGGDAVRPPTEPFDFDGDGRADISVFRPSSGDWYTFQSSNAQTIQQNFGLSGDIVAPADYDGDGKFDLGIFRPSTGVWWVYNSATGTFSAIRWGIAGDIPRPSDFDGDGKADFIVYRPSNNVWYRLRSTGTASITAFGTAGDQPLVGDFDADGQSDLAVFRPATSEWWWLGSDGNILGYFRPNIADAVPVPADYDGDNKTDVAVYRPENGTWYIYKSSNGSVTTMNFGLSEDKPVAADYDGDGKADIAVFRPSNSTWYLMRSTAGFAAAQFGASSDIAVPNSFVP